MQKKNKSLLFLVKNITRGHQNQSEFCNNLQKKLMIYGVSVSKEFPYTTLHWVTQFSETSAPFFDAALTV